MLAEPPPAVVAPADDETVIEVIGTRSDQAQKIDRRTYRVQDNAHAAQSDTLQLLRGLPAIVVTPDDELLMLGSGNVRVLVDERPIQGDVTQYLRTLHGSDIERIEIITNPSAQYAASGSGGIINIVLRRKRADGVTGSASLQASSRGRVEGSATVKLKRGKWAFEVEAQPNGGRSRGSAFSRVRTVEQPDGSITTNSATGRSAARASYVYLSGKASYELSPRTSLSLTAGGSFNRYRSRNETVYLGLDSNFSSFAESQRNANRGSDGYLQFDYDHKGKVDGETLKGSGSLYGFRSEPRLAARFDNGGGYTQDSHLRQTGLEAKLDWAHPMAKSRILSVGAQFDYTNLRRSYESTALGVGGIIQFANSDSFTARDSTTAAYATYQLQLGKLTLLPGVRFERFDRNISSPGQPSVAIHRTALFPSFHLDRPLGEFVTLTLSYARRIDRPDATQLRPYLVRRSALYFNRGNPDLRDQTNDSYELNLHYHREKLDVGLILYDRETANLWDYSYAIDPAGNYFSTPINAGHKSDRGAEIDLSSPLFRRVKGTASINLFNSIIPYDSPGGSSRFSQLRYSANATISRQGKDRPRHPGDVGQLQLDYQSPSREFQYRYSGRVSVNLSYTQNLSKTLALTGSLNGIGSGRSSNRLIAPSIQERTETRTRQPEFKLKLVKTFGPKK